MPNDKTDFLLLPLDNSRKETEPPALGTLDRGSALESLHYVSFAKVPDRHSP